MKLFFTGIIGAVFFLGMISVTHASTIVRSIPTGVGTGDIEITPDGTKVYVLNTVSGSVKVINTETDTVVKTIQLSPTGSAHWAAISPDGRELYVAERLSGNIKVISTITDTVIATIATQTGVLNPISLSPDGKKLYVPSAYSRGLIRMTVIDTATRTVIDTIDTVNPNEGVVVGFDGITGYMQMDNVSTNPMTVYTNVMNLGTKVVTGVIQDTHVVSISADGTKAWGRNFMDQTIQKVDLLTNATTDTAQILARPNGMLVDEDTKRIFVANDQSNVVTILDSNTLDILETIPVIDAHPTHLVLTPDGKKLYVAINDAGMVKVIDVDTRNAAPVLEVIGNRLVSENSTLEFTLAASDINGDLLSYEATNLPEGSTFNAETHSFSWTPDYDDAGVYNNVTFRVIDNGVPSLSDSEAISITVGDINRAPVVSNPGPQEVFEGDTISFIVSATDPDAQAVTITANDVPEGATFTGGAFTWTPSLSQSGIYTVLFTATDNGEPAAQATIEVIITVQDKLTPPEEEKDVYELLAELIAAVEGYDFLKAVEQSYMANLRKVESFLNGARYTPSENQIYAFIKKLGQDLKKKTITQEQYDDLLAKADAVLDAIKDDAFGMVPLMTQVVSAYPSIEETSSWANEIFADGRGEAIAGDKCGLTFKQCACAITSLSMVGRYHGIDKGIDGTDVNPLNMDNWLLTGADHVKDGKVVDGYDVAGNVLWPWALAYLGEEKDNKFVSHLRIENASTNVMSNVRTFIDRQGPALGFNKDRGHWVVLTGNLEDGGFSVRDPYWYKTKTTGDAKDTENSVQGYNNVMTKAALFAYQSELKPIQDIINFNVNSPAQLLVTDEMGRRTGFDPETGTFVNEIPGASYDPEYAIKDQSNPSGNPHYTKQLLLVEPEGEYFTLQVIGTGEGSYTLDGAVSDGDGSIFGDRVAAATSEGKIDSYTVVTLSGTDALPEYLKDILSLIPQNEQKKFVQAFKVVFAQTEKEHTAVTKTLIENLIRYVEGKYRNAEWAEAVVSALEELNSN